MRKVILHYHIYKNAGTSFDHVLAHSYGPRFETFDGPFPFFAIDQDQLDRIVMRRPQTVAFASHQIALPPPSSLDYRPLAAIFLRNPFLRIASIYRFKRGPETADGRPVVTLDYPGRVRALRDLGLPPEMAADLDSTSTGQAAQRLDLAGWLEHCLNIPAEAVHVSNAQTRFLSGVPRARLLTRRTAEGMTYDLPTALRNLAGVDLLGRTEHFEADVTRFAAILDEHGLPLTIPADTRKNVTERHDADAATRARAMLDALPPALAARLVAANRQDAALYDRACELIAADHRP